MGRSGNPGASLINAVTVSWDGAKRVKFVQWRDHRSYNEMRSFIRKAAVRPSADGELEVEVICVESG